MESKTMKKTCLMIALGCALSLFAKRADACDRAIEPNLFRLLPTAKVIAVVEVDGINKGKVESIKRGVIPNNVVTVGKNNCDA